MLSTIQRTVALLAWMQSHFKWTNHYYHDRQSTLANNMPSLFVLMVGAACFKIDTNTSTSTTALSVKTNTFTAAADGGAGVNIIHPIALDKIIKSNNVKLAFYDCKYRLIVVNQSVVEAVSYTHLRAPRDRQKSRMPSSA